MAATAPKSNLSGLPRRLVQDGIVTEEVVQEATEAARKEKLPLVAYLVANGESGLASRCRRRVARVRGAAAGS